MSLLSSLMKQARKAEIGYGIHENCIITKVSNDIRKNKEEVVISRNGYTMFEQLDASGEPVAEREFSWFAVDPTSEYAFSSFISQIEQMTGIVDAVYVNKDGVDLWSELFNEALDNAEIELDEENPSGAKDMLEEIFKAHPGKLTEVLDHMIYGYVKVIESTLELEEKPRVRLKVVYDSSGRYLQQPRFDSFVEPMSVPAEESILKLSKTDEENRANSLNPTAKPSAKKLSSL